MSRGIAAAFKEEVRKCRRAPKTEAEADIRERVGITNQPERCFIVSRGHPFGDTQVILWTGWPELAGGPEYVRSPVPVHRDRGSGLFLPSRVPIAERTVDCYFYQQSRCKKGSLCRYRHHPTLRTLSGTERCLGRDSVTSASSAPSTALSPLTSREHDLTTRRADSAIIKKCLETTGNIDEYSNTFDGNQEQRVGSRS
ncbi:hypothetical protein NQ317_001343 [Molorchus minor]|uniref:C3H1-type domain-containing protein n=1 Tax=Molorchus minor TaxID=1323400 RepID=A0ABQ9JN22_9CUCU|nr:hypothetical protein NQ317_001343 [Molorchus minor]